MAFRPDILAGKAVILVNIEDQIDKQLRGIRTKLRRFSNSLGDIGGDLFRGGSVSILGALFPVKEFIDFQDQLLFVQTKLRATDMEMLGLESTIRNLGKSTSFTSSQVAEAATVLAQAGFTLGETQKALLPVLDLARAGRVELETASNLLVQAIQSFALPIDQATEVASKLITAVRKGPLTVVDLGESFKYASGLAAELNVDLNDVLASLALLSRSGTRGTLAGTQVNKALQALATESDKLSRVLGISFQDEDFSSLQNVFIKFGAALEPLSRVERVSALTEIGSIRGARALAPLIRKLEQYDDILKEITLSQDEARTSADKLDSRLGGVYRRALSAAQEFLLAAGGTSEGPLTKFGEGLRKAFNELSALSTANPELLQTLFLLPPIALAAGTAFLTLSFALNKLASAMTPLISLNGLLFSSLQKIVGGNQDAARMIRSGAKSIGFGKGVSNLGKTKIPVAGLVNSTTKIFTSGIAKGVVAVGKGNPIRRAAVLLLNQMEKVFLIEGKRRRISLMITKPLIEGLEKVFRGGGSFGARFLNFAGEGKAGGIFGRALVGIRKLMRGISSVDVVKKLYTGFSAVGRVLRGVLVGLNGLRRFLFSFGGVLTIIEALILIGPKIKPIREFFGSIGTFFKSVGAIGPALGDTFSLMGEGLGELFGGNLSQGVKLLKIGLEEMVDIVGVKLSNAWRQLMIDIKPVVDFLKQAFDGMLQVINAIFKVIAEIGGATVNSVGSGVGSLFGGGGGFSITDIMNQFFAGLIAAIKTIGIQILKGLEYLSQVLGRVDVGIRALLRVLAIWDPRARQTLESLGLTEAFKGAASGIIGSLFGTGEQKSPFRAGIDALLGIGATPFIPEDAPLPVGEDGLQDRKEKRRAKLSAEALANEFKAFDGPTPLFKEVERTLEEQLSDLFKPDMEISQANRTAANFMLGELAAERNKITKERMKEVEGTFTKIESIVGTFASTRGQLLKLATRNEELNELKGIRKGVEEIATKPEPAFL